MKPQKNSSSSQKSRNNPDLTLKAIKPLPKLEYADLMDRFWAYLIDIIILAIPIGIIYPLSTDGITSALNPDYTRNAALISSSFQFVYFFLSTWLNSGQTLGQMILKNQVISSKFLKENSANLRQMTYEKLTVVQCILHSIGKLFAFVIWIDTLIGLIWQKGPQSPVRVTQYFAQTVVIKKEKSIINKEVKPKSEYTIPTKP